MGVTPGKNIMEVTGGSGEVVAREGSTLMAGLAASGFKVDGFQPLVHQNTNSMKPGDNVADMFKGQHVTVEAKPSSPLFDILGGVASSMSINNFKSPDVAVQRVQGPQVAAPKNSF